MRYQSGSPLAATHTHTLVQTLVSPSFAAQLLPYIHVILWESLSRSRPPPRLELPTPAVSAPAQLPPTPPHTHTQPHKHTQSCTLTNAETDRHIMLRVHICVSLFFFFRVQSPQHHTHPSCQHAPHTHTWIKEL